MKKFVFCYLILLLACSDKDCDDLKSYTSVATLDEIKGLSLAGTYQVSSISTDDSFIPDSLVKSRLYIEDDSLIRDGLSGRFHFNYFPVWINSLKRNALEDIHGQWTIHSRPGGLFKDDEFILSPSYDGTDDGIGKSVMAGLDIKLKQGAPLLIVRVLKNFKIDETAGDALIYPSSDSESYCNYLIYEKVSENE